MDHNHFHRVGGSLFSVQAAIKGKLLDHSVVVVQRFVKTSRLPLAVAIAPLLRISTQHTRQNQHGPTVLGHRFQRLPRDRLIHGTRERAVEWEPARSPRLGWNHPKRRIGNHNLVGLIRAVV